MSKDEWDHAHWNANPPILPSGWTRYPVTPELRQKNISWDAVPDEVYEDGDRPIFEEWRPSSMGGHGLAAIWVGPKEAY